MCQINAKFVKNISVKCVKLINAKCVKLTRSAKCESNSNRIDIINFLCNYVRACAIIRVLLRYSMLDFKSSYKQLLHNCGKSALFLQPLQKLMDVIYRILNGLYPSYLNDIITARELQQLRCQARLLVPSFSTIRHGKKNLSYLSPV